MNGLTILAFLAGIVVCILVSLAIVLLVPEVP